MCSRAGRYAGFLSPVGLAFLINSCNLLALTATFLIVAVSALTFRARQRRGYGPAVVGLAASAGVLIGKFYLESFAIIYVALGILIAASIWNTWPVPSSASCPECVATGEFVKDKGL